MQLPPSIVLRISRRLSLLLLAVHLGAMAALVLAALPPVLQVAGAVAIVASGAWLCRRLAGRRRVCRMTPRADGKLELQRADGSGGTASVLAGSTLLPWLVVLLTRCEDRRQALILLADALAAEDFRVLRLWLRWRAEIV